MMNLFYVNFQFGSYKHPGSYEQIFVREEELVWGVLIQMSESSLDERYDCRTGAGDIALIHCVLVFLHCFGFQLFQTADVSWFILAFIYWD